MTKKVSERHPDFTPEFTSGPPTLVYKTKADYQNLVPILLSDDKTSIISYPHPSDLKPTGEVSLPTPLRKNYLLDNRGIGKNVAFIKLTYEEYSKLESPPTLAELNQMIVDKDPLLELCDCGNRMKYTAIVEQLNQAIDDGTLRQKCKTQK